jgi:hypothetical protein
VPFISEPRFTVAHTLRVKGFAESPAVAEATGHPGDQTDALLAELAEAELIRRRDRGITGWSLTPDGRQSHAQWLGDERAAAGCDEAVAAAYDAFLERNEEFKVLCTDWQLRAVDGGDAILNDHTDEAYDAAIVERLGALHDRATPAVDALADTMARFGPYADRLAGAWKRVADGDRSAIARPLSGSYHDVWMELHQDLLLTLGRERDEADGH